MTTRIPVLRRCLVALALFSLTNGHAATTEVTTIAALQTAIGSAVAGDVIIVKNGVYTTTSSINVNKVGTVAAPITIKAETIGGVEFKGTHGISLASPAAYIVIEGFVFSNTSGRLSMPNGAHHCRYSRNVFQCTGSGAYLTVSGHDHEVAYNEFRNKSTVGNMIDVRGSGSQIGRRLWIHHNYFHDFVSPGQNGAETLRLGLSGLSMSTGDALVEYNLFVRCNGENELISNKSSGNTFRYNTLIDSPGAQLTLRHGNDCLAYGNYFRNTDGLRVYGDRHQIFSNYFEGNTKGIDMGNGDGEVADGSELTVHDRPDDCVVSHNTFVNNNVHYQMGGRTNGLGARNITFANNILQGPNRAVSISSSAPYTGTWIGNILWNVTTVGNIPSSGYTVVNPLLAVDANGILHLQAGSPAIDSGEGSFPAVTVDIDGQARFGARDKGADEFSSAPVVARILTMADVGPGVGQPQPDPIRPPIEFEAETLLLDPDVQAVGGTATISFEDSASGGTFASPNILPANDPDNIRRRFVTFGGDGVPPPPNGEYMEFTLPAIPAGVYDFVLRYKAHPTNRAKMILSIDGVQLGGELDQRTSAMFTTKNFGTVRFTEPGDHVVRLAVSGKSNATGPWNLTADVFSLFPDSRKPVITTPLPDLTLEATGPGGAVATYAAEATDDKDGPVPVVFTPASGSLFSLGTTVVIATAMDLTGNIGLSEFDVSVVDTKPPVLTLPADIVTEATSPAGAVVEFSATADDIVSGSLPVTFSPESGSVFSFGTTTVSGVAQDAAGNSSSGTFKVTVRDTTAPVIQSLIASPDNLGAPNHKMVPVTITAVVQDAGDASPLTRIISVTSSDSANGRGDGNTASDVRVASNLSLELRSERDGSAGDRIYTIAVESIDASGNASTATVQVIAPHDQRAR